MSFIDEVRADRQPLAHVLKKHRGIRKIVEDLYPDRAHFIYELLQNAEDAGATEADFALEETSVSFEHNGRPFSKDDIWGITDIGEGAKSNDEDKIGRFGIGFKAVFAYTETPHIWSPTFSFKISELVLPEAIATRSELGRKTRFEFPFNNPKKVAQQAQAEVKAGLNELAETTLLFLTNLKAIAWEIGKQSRGEVRRIEHSEHHVEVLRQTGGKTTSSSHFLRFSDSVHDLERQRVSVAFAMDCLPKVPTFDPQKALAAQLKIVPANPSRVAVFFPAEKETSGLRFHLHAPFVPELSRASVKDTPANKPLFKQLAKLAADSLHKICQLDLLTGEFLGVLPNTEDDIPDRYQPIRSAIIEELNNQPLTPTHSKSHAPAKYLLQAKASLKDLLSEEDLKILVEYDEEPPLWAISAAQKNSNADRFLDCLGIIEWNADVFVELLQEKARECSWHEPDDEFMLWLSGKPLAWHQHLYAILNAEVIARGGILGLNDLRLVRLGDGNYSVGNKCFFPSDEVDHDEVLPRVDAGVYTSGKSKTQQESARKFLEQIGVREVGEAEQVEAILQQRYTRDALRPEKKDLKRFIALVEKEPGQANVFGKYFIFELADGKWGTASRVFLDSPFLETGLSAYYEVFGKDAKRDALAERYHDCGIAIKRLAKFAEAVGAQTRLEVVKVSCDSNPQWAYLHTAGGWRWTSTSINQDYVISGLDELLAKPSLAISKLVWRTMCALPQQGEHLRATFRRNASYNAQYANSQLVHALKSAAWVPQDNNSFVRPTEATPDLLPEGFPFDQGWAWLKAIHFGQEAVKSSEERRQKVAVAKELGFADTEALKEAQWFAALPPEERERLRAEHERRQASNLPEHEPTNAALRAQQLEDQAAGAPERRTEERTRSVSLDLEKVKQKADQYLRREYTNPDGEMICQVCKALLPFKLDDGSDYFETVEFLRDLKKRHYQNYLALCPNHAAMFQYANGSADLLREMVVGLTDNELEVVLAQRDATIYFTKTHILELKKVIEIDEASAEKSGTARV